MFSYHDLTQNQGGIVGVVNSSGDVCLGFVEFIRWIGFVQRSLSQTYHFAYRN